MAMAAAAAAAAVMMYSRVIVWHLFVLLIAWGITDHGEALFPT